MAEGKEKSIYQQKTVCRTKKILSVFASALLPLQEYILSFQEAEPTIHKLFDCQIKLFAQNQKIT